MTPDYWMIGLHLDVDKPEEYVPWMQAVQPTVSKIYYNPFHMAGVRESLEASPHSIHVARVALKHFGEQWDDDFTRMGGYDNPEGTAHAWVDVLEAALRIDGNQWDASYRDRVYFEAVNEPHFAPGDFEGFRRLSRFEATRQRVMADRGLKACIGNFGVGLPPYEAWDHMLPMLEEAHKHGNLLGLHQYGGVGLYGYMHGFEMTRPADYFPTVTPADRGDAILRHRWVIENWLKPHGFDRVRIVINELGFDAVMAEWAALYKDVLGDTLTWGWRDAEKAWAADGFGNTTSHYANQMAHYNVVLNQDLPWVVGATIFTYGTINPGAWHNHDIYKTPIPSYLQDIGSMINTQPLPVLPDYDPNPDPPDPPDPDPEPDPPSGETSFSLAWVIVAALIGLIIGYFIGNSNTVKISAQALVQGENSMDMILDFIGTLLLTLEPLVPVIGDVANLFPVVVGASLLIPALIDGGKFIGIVKDGMAGWWSVVLNAIVYIVLGVLGAYGLGDAAGEVLAVLNEFVPVIISLILSLLGSKLTHTNLADRKVRPFVRYDRNSELVK